MSSADKEAYVASLDDMAKEVLFSETANHQSRVANYPQLQDQLDQLYWDKKNGTSTWEEGIDAVKAEYPKPTE